MARTLDVYLHRNLVGHLIQDEYGDMVFDYAESWLSRLNAIALSHSLPPRSERFSRNECWGYFDGILPESDKRDIVARNLGISSMNDFALLKRIGGECAGAVTFVPSGENLPERQDRYRILSGAELADILRSLPRRPLMAGADDVRISLAGAQGKIAVRIVGEEISLPLSGAPSTHILKPAIERYPSIVVNEWFCMSLAQRIGLPVAHVETGKVEDIDYLIVKRYDRNISDAGMLERLHQEDFCQALGLASEQKYQSEGGPSLKQCFQLVRETSALPVIDLATLLEGVLFNFLIGNNDAHGKNFSLLRTIVSGKSTIRLAPFYDLLSTALYPELSTKMAMNFGSEYDPEKVIAKHFERFSQDATLGNAMVKRRMKELVEAVLSTLATMPVDNPVAVDIAKLIQGRCEKTLVRLGA